VVQRIGGQQNLRCLQPSLTKQGSRIKKEALQGCSTRLNGSHNGNKEGNNQQKRLDNNAKENYRLYYLMHDDFVVNQTSEPLLLLQSCLCQMHQHCMEVPTLLKETRKAFMQRGGQLMD
jgi:hypothetical protein